MAKKIMYTLEYPIRCSPTILYEFLSSPVGLQEWFADKVDQKDEQFVFYWNGSADNAEMLEQFEAINRMGQTILMVTHSTSAASHAKRVLFIKDGTVFHQIYRGDKSEQEMYESISLTLTRIQAGE